MKYYNIDKLKKIIKDKLNLNCNVFHGDYDEKNFSLALEKLTNNKPELISNDATIGRRDDNKVFYPSVKKITDAFDFFENEIVEFGNDNIPNLSEYDGLHSGTPMKTKPFIPCIKCIERLRYNKTLYCYPGKVGNTFSRQKFVDYLIREGFQKNKSKNYDGLSVDNVVFTCSTTHAFYLIIKLIARSEDVILVTGPNYGLFAIMPERINARVEVINLREEDEFKVNAKLLSKRIDDINADLKKTWEGKLDYIPKVVAFLNMNPHNPIGNLLNIDDLPLIKEIGDVCLEKGVFVIDDLIYRDLTFNQSKLAYPLASIPKYFNNTISLFGISKAYGLASFRSGVVVAPIPICRGLGNLIFQEMDSIPILQSKAIEGAFNGTDKRYKKTKKYFAKIIPEYQYRLELTKALVYGINSIENENIRKKILKDFQNYEPNIKIRKKLLEGIPNVKIRKNTMPQSGFFVILDFTSLKGKKYKDKLIKDEFDLLKLFYSRGKVKYITGMSMSWPYHDEIVGRINFSLNKSALFYNMKIINLAVRELV